MKQFAAKSALFLLVNGLIGVAMLAAVDSRYHFEQYETDSILLSTPKNTHFGLVILGSSRARLLTRIRCNYELLERELDIEVLNLAIPFGGGIVPEKMFLRNFFDCGNSADTVLFFLDAFMLFSPQPNREHRFVSYEPLRPRFLRQMLTNDMPPERIFTYLESKFAHRWFTQRPGVVECDHGVIRDRQMDAEKVRKRHESLYFEGLSETYFTKYARVLEAILAMAQDNGCRIIIAFPPTLLGEQPGTQRLLQEFEKLRTTYDFEVHDFTNAIRDLGLYSDYDHLNSEGVEVFVTRFLRPVLRGSEESGAGAS